MGVLVAPLDEGPLPLLHRLFKLELQAHGVISRSKVAHVLLVPRRGRPATREVCRSPDPEQALVLLARLRGLAILDLRIGSHVVERPSEDGDRVVPTLANSVGPLLK